MPEGAETQDALVREFLAGRSNPCPMCPYDLRDLPAAVCPECGADLVLEIRPVEPRLGLWIVGLVGLGMGFGFAVILSIYAVAMSLRFGSGLPSGFLSLLITAPVLTGGLVGWVHASRRLRRFELWARTLLAAGAWILSIGLTVFFFVAIRR